MKILLDTNAYSALMRGRADVADRVRKADEVLLSAIVVGELLFGFRAGSRYDTNRRQLDGFLESPFVRWLPVSLRTADRFGQIAAGLRRKGKPLPSNDIWIAAHAMESDADLMSFDSHFEAIDGLSFIPLPKPP
jgi:predicted nucleic acid-binding protein